MSNKSKNIIIGFSIAVGLFFLFAIVVGVTMSISSNGDKAKLLSQDINDFEYERVSTENFPYAGRARFSTEVIVDEDITKENLVEVSKRIANEVIEERTWFQALDILYYTSAQTSDSKIATFTYAPEGRWDSLIDGESNFSNYEGVLIDNRDENQWK